VCIAESVPALIMKVYPWIHQEEMAFQENTSSPGISAEDQKRISDHLSEQWVNRLDPNDDNVWVDEPYWLKHLAPG
jgi:hypothetical protein